MDCSGGMRTNRLGSDSATRLRILSGSLAVPDHPERMRDRDMWGLHEIFGKAGRLIVAAGNSMRFGVARRGSIPNHWRTHEQLSQKNHKHDNSIDTHS